MRRDATETFEVEDLVVEVLRAAWPRDDYQDRVVNSGLVDTPEEDTAGRVKLGAELKAALMDLLRHTIVSIKNWQDEQGKEIPFDLETDWKTLPQDVQKAISNKILGREPEQGNADSSSPSTPERSSEGTQSEEQNAA